MFSREALDRVLLYTDISTVLDVGSGIGEHADEMRRYGYKVTTINLLPPANYVGDFINYSGNKVDCIWASHVCEHQTNVGLFLKKCFNQLRDDGLLAITVPPAKHNIVGGHVTLFNQGLLLYNLILAGFDCRKARVSNNYISGLSFPYNLSVLVRKKKAILPSNLNMDSGDITKLAEFFPMPVNEGFNGYFEFAINW